MKNLKKWVGLVFLIMTFLNIRIMWTSSNEVSAFSGIEISLELKAYPAENVIYGDTVLLEATIYGFIEEIEATGTVTFKENDIIMPDGENLPLLDNKAVLSYIMPVDHGIITAEYSGDTNYEASIAQLDTYVIGLAEQEPLVEPTILDVTYPDVIDVSIVGGGTTNAEVTYSILSGGTGDGFLNGAVLTPTKAGTFFIAAVMEGDSNYNPTSVQYTITVNPKKISISDTAVADKIYDGTNTGAFITLPSLEGIEEADTYEVELLPGTPTFTNINAGEQIEIIFADFIISGEKSQNYSIVQPEAVHANIYPRDLTVTAVSQTRIYGEDTVLTAEVTGFAERDSEESLAMEGYIRPSVFCSISHISNDRFAAAGTYAGVLTASGGVPTSNYIFNYIAGDLTVTKGEVIDGIHYAISSSDGENGWFSSEDFTITPKQGVNSSYNQISITEEGPWLDSLVFTEDTSLKSITFYLKDSQTNAISLMSSSHEYKIDKTKPDNLELSYTTAILEKILETITFGYYNPAVTVTLKAGDTTSGIDSFHWQYTKESGTSSKNEEIVIGKIEAPDIVRAEDGSSEASFTLTAKEAQYRGNINFSATDAAGNRSDTFTDMDTILIVDTISPTRTVTYNSPRQILDAESMTTKTSYSEGSGSIFFYDEEVIITFQIDEANFYPEDIKILVEKEEGTVSECAPENWEQTANSDLWAGTVTLFEDGAYTIYVSYPDRSGNEMEAYKSEKIVIDTVDPIIRVSYNPDTVVQTVENENYYNEIQTATITITEHNFRAKDITAIITAQDITGKEVMVSDFAAYLQTHSNWEQNGDVYTTTITYSVDAHYTFDLKYSDLALREAAAYETDFFLIDTTAAANLQVSYSTPHLAKLLQTITFGYYKPAVKVTLTAEDMTAGIMHFNWSYTKESGTSAVNLSTETGQINRDSIVFSNGGKTAAVTFTLTADVAKQYRGNISFYVTDMAENTSACFKDNDHIIVVDTISPTRSVSYNNPKKMIDRISLLEKPAYFENSNSILYYDEKVTANFRIEEANFYSEDVSIEVTKNGSETYNLLPSNWIQTADTDQWTGSITLEEDGEYFIQMNYIDRATNKMITYISEQIIIDTIAPVRVISFSPCKQVADADSLLTKSSYSYTEEGTNSILYYDADVTVICKITETNFYAKDVLIQVNDQIYAPISWVQNGDEWTGIITLSGEGDYRLSVAYMDKSGNAAPEYSSEKIVIDRIPPVISVTYSPNQERRQVDGRVYYDTEQTAVITVNEHNFRADDITVSITAKDISGIDIPVPDYAAYLSNRSNWKSEGDMHTAVITYHTDANYTFSIRFHDLAQHRIEDYTEDTFTVDTTPPTDLSISYSTHLAQVSIDSFITEFYNEPVTVTIAAEDSISGVHNFEYNSMKATGTNSINGEIAEVLISNTEISYYDYGRRAVATFSIPRSEIENGSQFNGTTGFTVYDKSSNSADRNDTKRIVVDNIAPNATVTYNAPVQQAGGISYYGGDISATITVKEANFIAEDIHIMILKDGEPAYSATPTWNNLEAEIYSGVVVLVEEGNYTMTLTYKDRSNNEMAAYTSGQMTIDITAPVVQVEGITEKTAYNDTLINFEISASDVNFDKSQFDIKLSAVIRQEDGSFQIFETEMDSVNEITAGKEYSYQIDNLESDGIYTLNCEVTDMAGNRNNTINLAASPNKQVNELVFSVNREGSTFMLDENSQNLVESYYKQAVYNDIIIDEINVDILETYHIRLNNERLKEGRDYTVSNHSEAESWNRYTYTIKRSLFEEEGEYNLVICTEDKAQNKAYSDMKSAKLTFMIDRTSPIITLSGLSSNGCYQEEIQTVTLMPRDDGGKLNSLKVTVSDSSNNPIVDEYGNDISLRVHLEGEEFYRALEENANKITFEIPSGTGMHVRLICDDLSKDLAGNTNTYDETFYNITVSPDIFKVYYANKYLFYGSIAGIVLISASLLFFFYKKNTKIP